MSDRWSLAVELPRADPIRTEIVVRLRQCRDAAPLSGLRCEGRLRGPVCDRSTTLPLTVPLAPRAPSNGQDLLLVAVLNEPAFWTEDLPVLYELSATVNEVDGPPSGAPSDGARRRPIREDVRGLIGLRRLWTEGRSIRLDGRRCVIRGVTSTLPDAIEVEPRGISLVLDVPAAAGLAAAADRNGRLLVLRASVGLMEDAATLSRRHPSAAFLITRSHEAATESRVGVARGRGLVGLEVDATLPPPDPPIPADFLVANLPRGGLPHPAWVEPPALPLMASRPTDGSPGRDACDRLQADLAGWATSLGSTPRTWDWSGYLVDGGVASAPPAEGSVADRRA